MTNKDFSWFVLGVVAGFFAAHIVALLFGTMA